MRQARALMRGWVLPFSTATRWSAFTRREDDALYAAHDGRGRSTRNPRIAVSEIGDDAIALDPQTIELGEEQIVLEALRELLA